MKYRLLVSDESRLDIIDAYSWYELQREGLGKDFELCLEAGFDALTRNPKVCPIKYRQIRVFYIRRFPFGIHYSIEFNDIKVFSVFHTSRNPNSWKSRL